MNKYDEMSFTREKRKKTGRTVEQRQYRLNQDMDCNGIKYFGQEGVDNFSHRTAMFICPKCKELFRSAIYNIERKKQKSCMSCYQKSRKPTTKEIK